MFFPQTQYIFLWWLVTGAVFSAGAGAAIIGGLYWEKGTATAAWSAAISGSVLCLIGIACGAFWPTIVNLFSHPLAIIGIHLPDKFWFNYQVSGFIAQLTAATVYVVVSLVTSRQRFNLDRMLHRGQYALATEAAKPQKLRERFTLANVFRFDENFTLGDKIIASGIFWWAMVLVAINGIILICSLCVGGFSARWWASYWLVLAIIIPLAVSIVTGVWFTIGGFRDIGAFFTALKTISRSAADDGRVDLRDKTRRGFQVVPAANVETAKLK